MSSDYSSGTSLIPHFKDTSFAYPTTIARAGDRLLVVNSQFDTRPTNTPVLPFTLSGIELPLYERP